MRIGSSGDQVTAAADADDFAFDAFISYERGEAEFARQLAGWLRLAGHSVWLDEEQLFAGLNFRAGLQQGIRESRHVLALITKSYVGRDWPQREIDLFDVEADGGHRRLLGLCVDAPELDASALDQVFLVHQRISWRGTRFDAEGLWLVHCGLIGQAPGPKAEWHGNGAALVDEGSTRVPPQRTTIAYELSQLAQHEMPFDVAVDPAAELMLSAAQLLDGKLSPQRWEKFRSQIRGSSDKMGIPGAAEPQLRKLQMNGYAPAAAVVALAWLPNVTTASVWPFLDLGLSPEAEALMLRAANAGVLDDSELWFNWCIATESWPYLPSAAGRAPHEATREHFHSFASSLSGDFSEFEDSYNFRLMITPWNLFHLCWLAVQCGNHERAQQYADALGRIGTAGDIRARRFLVRMNNWTIFRDLRVSSLWERADDDRFREAIDLVLAEAKDEGLIRVR